MKVSRLELEQFKRFVLTGLESLDVSFTAPLQVIIGTNGSGKSSLLEQLTVWPRNAADFSKSGNAALEFEDQGSLWRLAATFEGGQRHYLSKDGVALNDWGNSVVQRELITKHFGITPMINELLKGQEKLTQIGPMRRKEWFIELCEANYDYAIKVYNKCKEKLRDCEGALKVAKKRLSTETEKLLKEDEEKKLIQELETFHQVLESLMEMRIPVDEDVQVTLDRIYKTVKDVDAHGASLSKLQAAMKQSSQYTEQQVEVILEQLRSSYAVCQALLERDGSEYHKNAENIAVLQKTESKSIEALDAEVSELVRTIEQLKKDVVVTLGSVAAEARSSFEAVRLTLLDSALQLKPNPDRRFSRDKKSQAEERLLHLKKAIGVTQFKLADINTKIAHLNKHKETPNLTCPKCQHHFSTAFSQLDLDECLKIQAGLVAELAGAQKEEEQLQAYTLECAQYGQLFTAIIRAQQSTVLLRPYWDKYMTAEDLYNDPNTAVNAINVITQDLDKQVLLQQAVAQLQQKMELLQKLKSLDTADIALLQKRQEVLGHQIESTTARLDTITRRQKKFQQIKSQIKTAISLLKAVEQLSESLSGDQAKLLETRRRIAYNAFIRELQSMLAQKAHVLQELKSQQKVVSMLSSQITELEQEAKAYSALVSTLCPNTGLIAEGLYGFLTEFIFEMNTVINSIWTYELTLGLPQAEEGVELNYKFPVTIAGEQGPKDISLCSEGQQDIIDFAFMLVARRYLGKEKYPLVLDELGRTFDAAHKDNLVMYLKQLIEETDVQIFMVSHDFKAYSSLSAEYLVLSKDNVVLPPKYNQHVKK